jgi:hypothetical protein
MKITMKMHQESILGKDELPIDFSIEQDKLIEQVKRAWTSVFGKDAEPKVRVVDNPVGDDDMPNWGLIVDESFEIYPGNVKLTDEEMLEKTFDVKPYRESRKDKRPHDVVRLILTAIVPEHNYPHEPDGQDEIEVAYSVYFSDLVDRMIHLMAQHRLDNLWEHVGIEEMLEEDKKYENWLHG